MKQLFFSFALALSLEVSADVFPVPGYTDRTTGVMTEHEKKGIEVSAERSIEGIQVKLYISQSAKTAIANSAFLIPDAGYDQDKFNSFILDTFETSLEYLRQINPNQEVKILNLVLIDKGGDVGTISEVPVHSRVIELHLGRWHKYFLRDAKSFVAVSSIHEFAHIINYIYSPKETRLHREMTGVMVECLNFIQLYGMESFLASYRKSFTSKMTDLTVFNSDVYTNMNVIRNMAFIFFQNLYSGTYTGSTDSRKTSEEFVMNYLMNSKDDQSGFDDALTKAGIKLTFKQLREDTLKDLKS
ncbi:MAG TPA: hypothetical protein VNJ08_04055 [Bacteriovoracaceae bacterium]|nr:hypothetical protein [Bacteriovoracaceae bacterium]